MARRFNPPPLTAKFRLNMDFPYVGLPLVVWIGRIWWIVLLGYCWVLVLIGLANKDMIASNGPRVNCPIGTLWSLFFGTIVWQYCMASGPTGYILAASPFGNKAPVHWHLEQWCLLPDQLFWSHAPFFGCCILRDLICILVKWTLLAAVFTEIYSVNCILLCASNILFCVVVVWCAWCKNMANIDKNDVES